MVDAVRCKFSTHKSLQDLLLPTGNARIAENAPMDSDWGIGPDGSGVNRLGQILMQVRGELRNA